MGNSFQGLRGNGSTVPCSTHMWASFFSFGAFIIFIDVFLLDKIENIVVMMRQPIVLAQVLSCLIYLRFKTEMLKYAGEVSEKVGMREVKGQSDNEVGIKVELR